MSQILRYLPSMASLGPAVLTVGVFDGVHLGHRALLSDTVALAGSEGALAVAVTFDRDPETVLRPDSAPPRILNDPDRLEMLAASGVDAVVVVDFDESVAAMSSSDFVNDVIAEIATPFAVTVGADFRFGTGGSGDVDALRAMGKENGWRVIPRELLTQDDIAVTSTRIRALVQEGSVGEASSLLGRTHYISGPIVHGRGAGRGLGAPTANIRPPAGMLVPSDGVYAGRFVLDRQDAGIAAVSVGRPPMFPEAEPFIEAHLIGLQGEHYGRELRIEFARRLREHAVFSSEEELSRAIAKDIAAAKALLTS